MPMDIPSFAGKVNDPAYAGQSLKSGRENYRSGSTENPVNSLGTVKEKPVSIEVKVLESIGFSSEYKVDYKVNQETQKLVIHVVDTESGEVVRQIPGEDFVKLAQRIAEFNRSFFDQTT